MNRLDTNKCAACDADISEAHGYVFQVHGITFTLCDSCARKYNTDDTFRRLVDMRAEVLNDINNVYGRKCDMRYEEIIELNKRLADPTIPEYFSQQSKAQLAEKWKAYGKYNAIRQELIKIAGGEVYKTLYDDIEEVDEEDD